MDQRWIEAQRRKEEVRVEARARRRRQENPEHVSRVIFDRLAALPEYARADTVLFYVAFRSEVHTQHFLPVAWRQGKRVVVPYCLEGSLVLCRLESLDDLSPGAFGIPEPKVALRCDARRKIEVREVDLIVTPGLAFDRACARIGYGKGYYDRLLQQARPDTALLAAAFQCQMFPEVPVLPYDVRVDKVVTEEAVYERAAPRYER
jgi:5-formyltetrahydrofolate cyclo-ligase